MVLINGTQFVVYDLDTQQSAIKRLAAKMNTTPRYLYFPNGIPSINDFREENKDIRVEDLLEVITSDSAGYDFVPIFEQLKNKIVQQNLDIRFDILLPFVVFNKSVETHPPGQMRDVFLLMMQSEIDKSNIFEDKPDVQRIWSNDKVKIMTNITNGIKENQAKVEEQRVLFDKFENISNAIQYTPFELERVNIEFTLNMVHLTIMELFNHIQLNTGVPFACVNKFFKILKDFIPPEEWGIYLDSAIIFKVLQKSDLGGSKFSDYTDAILSVRGEPGEEVVTVGMGLMTSGHYLTREKIIDRFLNTIKGWGEIKVKTIKENRVNGLFYFPKHKMNKYVLSDMIMNNPLFSSMISIDESEKASKKKESVYIHFYHPKIGHVAANITEKISEKGDPTLRGKDVKGDFKFGTNYIRVKISTADSIQSVQAFQDLFAKLIVIYDQEYQTIVDFYRVYIPDFARREAKPIKSTQKLKLKLKDVAPEVFVKGYPPKCPHQPTIIDDDEVNSAEARGKIVMRYPQDENEGFIQYNYICDHKEAKYPGLRSNPLSNRELVPYLPCCYTKDHSERKGSIYRHYYFGDDLRTKVNEGQQDLILTNKFVPRNKYGTLPEDITKLFDIFDYNEGYMYVRKGVFDNRSSFLDCVMEGMYEETQVLDLDDKNEREAYLYQVRENLANAARAASCRQEMYDFTTEEIITAIRDPDVYMDPKLFTSMLEDFFDCNIYVFNRTGIRSGQLALPRHLQSYYKTKRRRKSVFIYEHSGSLSDHSKYPRCELITRWRIGGGGEDDVSYYSPYESKVSQGVRGVFNRMRKAYALDIEIPETEFDITGVDILEQGIDSYGKCRMLRFKYKGAIGTLLTAPMKPLPIPEVKGWVATKIDQDLAVQFAVDVSMNISGQSVVGDVVKEIYGLIGNVKVSIPVEDSIPIDNVPLLDKGISYPENEFSVIESYNKYKKLARYITEYMFWLFSNYLHDDSSRKMDLETIQRFVNDKIKLVPDFDYGHVGKIFNEYSGIMDGGKLVIKSEEALKRLMYTLRVSLRRHRQKIINYHTRKVIEKYYEDVTDFDQYQFQVILQGDESVEKWIHEQKIKYHLHDSVQIGISTPYFFKNDLVGPQIYLAQNTNSVYKAIEIAKVWLQSGYNPGADPLNLAEQIINFTLYRYINEKDIKVYRVGDIPTPLDIRMLGYKIEDDSFFTVLLSL
jgi:hypothetical protein